MCVALNRKIATTTYRFNLTQGDTPIYLFYKVLKEDGSPFWGGEKNWPLPGNNTPGGWLEETGDLEETSNGLHLCTLALLPFWIGPAIFLVETEGEILNNDLTKPVARKARIICQISDWNHNTLEDFTNKCFLHVYEQVCQTRKNKIDHRIKPILDAKLFQHVPREIAEYADSYEAESQWQRELVYEYIKIDEYLDNQALNTDSLKLVG